MTSKLGVYWSVMHRRQQDYAYFKALQPSVFKIMDGGPPDYQFARDNLPETLVIARDWALSEQHQDMLQNPVGTGQRHALEWSEHQVKLGFDRTKTLVLGINEPHIWEAGIPEALRLYTIALCSEATRLGLRVGAMQLSVGWPRNNGPDTPPDWSPWHGVEEAILLNGGALVVHEYWADKGPQENWGWWGGRSFKCPWQVPIVIGECGVDMFVKDTSVGQQNRGWLGHMPPERYAAELAEYTSRMSADPRFVGCCVFASDFAAHEWYSFDVEPAYKAILATSIPVQPTTPPITTHLPSVGTGPSAPAKTAYISVPSGANLRVEPTVDSAVIVSVPYQQAITVTGYNDDHSWAQVQYQGKAGWMNATLFNFAAPGSPAGTPTEPPLPPLVAGMLIWPVDGPVTQYWGENPQDYARFGIPGHNGLDIAAPQGTPVKAVADGIVKFVAQDTDYGLFVRIYHPAYGFHSFVGHLSQQQVVAGQPVKQGQVIGLVGSTGNSTGAHCHLETRLGWEDGYYELHDGYRQGRANPLAVYGLINGRDPNRT